MKSKKQIDALDVLKRIKSILIKRGWVQGYYAKSKSGRSVEVSSKAAAGYCLTGARFLAETELLPNAESSRAARELIAECIPAAFNHSPESFNDADATKKKDVIAVVNCAIQKAQRA